MTDIYDRQSGRTGGSGWTGAFGRAFPPTLMLPVLRGMHVVRPTRAYDGKALYVDMGAHESKTGFSMERYTRYGADADAVPYSIHHGEAGKPGWARVYFVMPADLAQENKKAEAQHLNDHQIAWDRTFGLLEGVLASLEAQGVGAQVPPPMKLRTLFQTELRKRRIKLDVGTQFIRNGLNLQAWKTTYEALIRRSGLRDTRGWHTFEFTYVPDPSAFSGLQRRYLPNGQSTDTLPPVYMLLKKCPVFNLNPSFDQIV
jgi:hypothetical protein